MAKLVVFWAMAAAMAATTSGQARADFSGTWVLEPALGSGTGGGAGGGRGGGNSRGGGLGMGPSPTGLVIAQDATSLTISQTGSRVSKVVYRLDGTETKGLMPAPDNSTRPATFRSVWKDARLVTTIVTRREQGSDIRLEEVRYLNPKGYLVVEISIPGQPNARRTVYSKGRVPTSSGPSWN